MISREDRRALYGLAEIGLPGEVEQHRADRPAEEDAGYQPQREPGDPVEQPHAGDEAEARAKRGGEHPGEAAHDRPEQNCAGEGDDGHIRRAVRRMSGASRAPRYAPRANPASENAPRRKPVAIPYSAETATTPRTTQSAVDTFV